MKRHKKPVKLSDTNGDAQVFVLPPDLLEKLGIQLSDIASTAATNDDVSVDQDLKRHLEEATENVANSSILETANLMKQSVFMSPTFVTTSESANEHTVTNITTGTAEAIQDLEADNQLNTVNNVQMTKKSEDKKKYIIKDAPYDVASEAFMNYEPIKEYEVDNESGDLVLINSNPFYNNTVMSSLTRTSPINGHVDEAYLSDGSNSNPRIATELTNNNFQIATEHQKPNNKIKILSEEIIHNSDLHTIKKTQIHKTSSCFLIPVNTIVTGKVTKDCPNKQSNHNIVQDEFYNTTSKNIGKYIIKNVAIVNNRLNLEDVDPRSQFLGTDNEIADIDYDTNSKKMLNKNDDTQKKYEDISAGEKEKVNAECSNTEEASNTENTLINSKLSIQGVEKPGGYQLNNVVKTYGKTKKKKRLPEIYHINNTNTEHTNVLEDVQTDLDAINISGGNKFCICSDYGRLADYDCDDVYEHLHFHNHSNVICTLETVLSMYEDTLLRDRTEMEHIEMVDDVVDPTVHNICWSSIMSEDKDENEDPAVLESNIKCQTNSGQPRRSNRKRKLTTEQLAEKVEPKTKKTIKCGACGLLLLETEWNKHKDSAHSLIAWKDDQSIDLKNKNLLKKLGQKLKKFGFLRCTFCEKEFKYLTKFTQHVSMCIKRKTTTSNNDDKQTENSQPPRKSPRNLISGTGTSEPDSKLCQDKKPVPKSPKIEQKVPRNFRETRHVEVNDITKSKVTPKVNNQIKVKSTRKSMNDSMETSKREEKEILISVDDPKEKESSVRSTRRSTVENKNNFQAKISDITKLNDTANKEESTSKAVKNKNILPAKETANTTGVTKSSNEKETIKSPKKSKTKEKASKLEERNFHKSKEDFSIVDLKTKRRSISDVKASLDVNDDEKTKPNGTPKSSIKHSTNLKKKSISEQKNTKTEVTKITPKMARTSIDASKDTPKQVRESSNEKITQNVQMEATLESSINTSKTPRIKPSTKSQEAPKLGTEATPKSRTRLSKAEITSKSYSSTDTLMVEHSKSTSKNVEDEMSLENAAQSKCHKKDRVTDRVSLESKIKNSPHSKKTATEVTQTSIKETATGRLKEIDLFSSTTSCEKNTDSPQKPIITSQIGKKNNLKSSKCSVDEPSKSKSSNSSKEIISLNLKRKSVHVSSVASARTPKSLKDENKNEATTDCVAEPRSKREGLSFNSDFTLNITTNNDKASKGSTSSAKTHKNTQDTKSNVKSQEVSSSTICSAATSAKPLDIAASTEKDDHSLLNPEIVIANTTTADNSTAAPSNSQSTAACGASSSKSDQDVTSSTNISPNKTPEGSDKDNPPPVDKVNVSKIKQEVKTKCAVCKQDVDDLHWLEHIAKEHEYLAWRENETPLVLDNEEAIRVHLCAIAKRYGELRCFKCNTVRKYARAYRTHVKNCSFESQLDHSTDSLDMDTTNDPDDVPLSRFKEEGSQQQLRRIRIPSDTGDVTSPNAKDINHDSLKPRRKSRKLASSPPQDVICAVCNETVSDVMWIDHIRLEHKYLAWKIGDPPLDVTNDIEVKIFLQNISKFNGGLVCSKCGVIRYYVKKWFQHEAVCTGDVESSSSEDIPIAKSAKARANVIEHLPDIVKCGKCGKEMPSKAWTDHMERDHAYLAWIEGHPPLDLDNAEAVNAHLHALMKKQGALYCAKCGISRKYPKAFLSHVDACETSGFKREDFYVEASVDVRPDEYECAVCLVKGPKKDWKSHAMDKHYNIAWMAGQIPINLKNPYAVEKFLKEYRLKHSLTCKVCGASRSSCYGFYAHILTCGKEESDLEHLMSVCEICNNKYLCIYRNQHIQMHREKQKKDEQKITNALRAEEEKKKLREEEGVPMGKRRAAQRARKVLEKYKLDKPDGNHVCLACHIGFDNQNLLNDHVCRGESKGVDSDSDESVKMEGAGEESEDDMDLDSSISEEEQEPIRRERKKMPDSSQPKIVLPYKLTNLSRYCEKSFENFCDLHYSRASLFCDWLSNEFMILPEEQAASYLPSLTNSCKIQLGDEWCTLSRFEGLKNRDNMTLFTGAAIRCMQWVPNNIACEDPINYLSISCYQNADCPRYSKDELHQHPGLIQIWNIDVFMSTPKFDFGIAHDFGTVWAMDWCPSGGRDLLPTDADFKESQFRLGLLGVACSNGSAYILSVPLIRSVGAGPTICRLKPVAELRICSKPKDILSRTGYQATSISWSPQKGHEIVMVGYSDGTTAFYNLTTTSPFLKSMENGVHIFYPFHDALTENSAVTGVSLSASQDLRRTIGGVASSSVTGATMSAWPGPTPVARSHLAASGLAATPNWPATLLCSDDLLTAKATNVLEWWGGGRRFGGTCTASGCARCGRLAVAAPPFVRLMRPHPAYTDLKKQIIATLKMVPIAQKRKLKTDNLGMVVEPLTYDETIKKYGLEFRALPKKNEKPSKLCNAVEQCPERFPLSEMPAVSFCHSPGHHNRLAIASHAGFVFIIIA